MKTFYRFHRHELPALCAENAYSAPWGSTFLSPSTIRCFACGGEYDECEYCHGTGEIECEPGYSCCDSLQSLADYFAARGGVSPELCDVYEFAGRQVGAGPDGEPLAIPNDATIRKLDQSEWLPLVQAAEAA